MPGQNVIIRTEGFQVKESQEEKDDSVILEGLAVPYEKESRNGIIYSEQSLKKNSESMIDKPFLYNHDVYEVLGRVTDVEVAEEGLRFTAELDSSKERVQDIKKGYIKTVSIQAMVDEADEGPDNRVDVNEFLELSATPIPGFEQAQATAAASAVSIEKYMQEKEQDKKSEPFAGYDDFDDCVQQNQDKSDPEDYCGAIKKQVEDEETESLDDLDLVPTDEMKDEVDPGRECAEKKQAAIEACEKDDERYNDVNGETTVSQQEKEVLEELNKMTDEEKVENDGCEECEDSQEEAQKEEQEMEMEQKIDQLMEMMEEMMNQMAGGSEESNEEESETSEESVASKQPVGTGSNTESKLSADKLANEIF